MRSPPIASISWAREWLLHRDVEPRFPIFDESTREGSANLKQQRVSRSLSYERINSISTHANLHNNVVARAEPLRRRPYAPHPRAPCPRGCDLGDARRQYRSHVPGDARPRRQAQPDRLLARPARLEEPDADAQSRRDLLLGVLRHEEWADRDRDSTGRRRR